ncbi:MAG: alpha/beta hydrolase [Lachnospiraceae bacterium]|nr:alpha/beta hydrolase [Lachnospiraceae bacterium]
MIEKQLEIQHGTIYYYTSENWDEDRKTIFFFHGLTANHTMFEKQFEFFCDEFNVIAWDSPGHGKSRLFRVFTMDEATDIILKIMKQEKFESFIAVGQSYGGYFPQAIMCRKSGIVQGFVGIGTSPYGEDYYSEMDYWILRRAGLMCRFFPWPILKLLSAIGVSSTMDGFKNMMQMLSQYDKKEYEKVVQDYYDALVDDIKDVDIDCPVLLTIGQHDRTGKVRKYNVRWHKHTGCRLEVIKGASHNANVDNPDRMNEIIYSFVCNLKINSNTNTNNTNDGNNTSSDEESCELFIE